VQLYEPPKTLTMKSNRKTIILIAFLSFIFSCKKGDDSNYSNNNNNNQPSFQLTKVDYTNGTSTTHHNFTYNSDNKITSITKNENSNTPSPYYQVSYNGNQVVIIRTEDNTDLFENTSITYTLDAGNKPTKRIYNYYIFFKTVSPTKYYTQDTTTYEYDAAGLLSKTISSKFDSAWYNPAANEQDANYVKTVTTYSYANGNIISSTGTGTNIGYKRRYSNVYPWNKTQERTTTYEYTKNYLNKLDFSNAIILNEFGSFNFPVSSHFKNIPDKVTWNYVEKDANTGNILTSSTNPLNMSMDFNSQGYLSSIYDPAYPQFKTNLTYEAK
jgi:hypothetical protein